MNSGQVASGGQTYKTRVSQPQDLLPAQNRLTTSPLQFVPIPAAAFDPALFCPLYYTSTVHSTDHLLCGAGKHVSRKPFCPARLVSVHAIGPNPLLHHTTGIAGTRSGPVEVQAFGDWHRIDHKSCIKNSKT
jgi:hypothetical protein